MKFLLLLAVTAVVSATYDPFYFGTGHADVVYKYYADVRTEVHDPEDFASQFLLRGDLHIHNDKAGNGSVFWLTNVEIYAYNGKDFYTWETVDHWTPLPKGAEAYMTPFYVTYYETGLVDSIVFRENAPEWVYNVQRGIASTFQLDYTRVAQYKKTGAFETYESSIYGNCTVDYEVVYGESEYVVTKYQDPRHCEGYGYTWYGNYFPVNVHTDYDDEYHTRSHRVYNVGFDGHIRSIFSNSGITRKMSPNMYNSQFVSVLQKFDFVDYTESKTDVTYDFTKYFPLTFTVPHVDADSYVPDITFGFEQFDAEHNVKRVHDIFYEAVEYLEHAPINKDLPDSHSVKQGQAINRIVALLRYFNVEQFQAIFDSFVGRSTQDLFAQTLFYRVLPNVGTRPAALFIRSLIVNGKVTGYEAAQLLYTLGTNFLVPTEEILTDLEDFLHFENQKPEVRSAAILTYATLVYKTFYKHYTPAAEKYIKQYYMYLQKATTYEDRLVWLEGLGNIRFGSVYNLLRPIVLGEQVFETPYDHHFRVHAIWQTIYAVRETKYDAFETFWPVFADTTLITELRIAALKGLVLTGTFTELKHVFHFMVTERNPHLVNYYYTLVHAASESQMDIFANATAFAEQFHQYYNSAPFEVNTRSFISDFYNQEHGLGYFIAGNTIANETTNKINQFFYAVNTQYKNVFFNNFAMYFKFDGIDLPLSALFSGFYDFDLTTWRSYFLKKTGPVHVEIIFTFHDQVFFVRHFDETTINNLFTEVLQFFNIIKYTYTGVFYGVQETYNVPTEFGFAAQFYTQIPFVYHFNYEPTFFQSESNAIKFKFQDYVRFWSHSTYGLQVYNQLASTYQGVRRVLSYDLNVPFNLNIAVDYKAHTLRISQSFPDEPRFNTFGVKTHSSNQVYTLPDRTYNVLDITCSKCSHYVFATNPEFREHQDLVNYHYRFFGREFYFGVYDYEYSGEEFNGHGFPHDLVNFDFMQDFGKVSFQRFFLSFHNWFLRNSFVGHRGNFGFVFYQQPCTQYPVNEWVFTTKVQHERDEKHIVPDHYFTLNSSITTHYNGQLVTEYFFNGKYNHIYGHPFSFVNFHFWRHTAESNQRFHVYYNRDITYNEQSVTGSHKFYFGTNYGNYPVLDQFYMTLESHAERSAEQQADYIYHDNHHTYAECMPQFPWVTNYTTTADCIFAHASLRHYRFYFNYVNLEQFPKEFRNYFNYFWHYLLTTYQPTYHATPFQLTGENSFAVEYVYPIGSHHSEVYGTVTFPGYSYTFSKFPVPTFFWFNDMEYMYFPKFFRVAREFGNYKMCEVFPHKPTYTNVQAYTATHYPTEQFELYAANKAKNYDWAVYVQRVGTEQVAAKFVIGNEWFVVRPVEEVSTETYGKDRFQFTTSSGGLEYVTGVNSGLFGLRIFYVRDTVVFVVPEQGVIYTYNGHSVRVANFDFNSTHDYFGHCYV